MINYQDINQAVFGCRYSKQVNVGDEGKTLLDSGFIRLVYNKIGVSFCLVNNHLPEFLLQQAPELVEDLKTLEGCAWGIDVLNNILLELQLCEEGLTLWREEASGKTEASKSKMVHKEGAL